MKKLILLFLLCPALSFAQIGFKNIAGKWQEENRTSKRDRSISFTDTIRMEIRMDGFMMIRHNKGATVTGQAQIKGNKLVLEKLKFTIAETANNNLILINDEGSHHFIKAKEFTSSPVTKLIPGVEEGIKDISSKTLKGKWTCYKKTDPEFKSNKFYLKNIDFSEDKGNGNYGGKASFNNSDSVYTTEASISINGTELVINTVDETLKANFLKSDGEEIILKSGNIHYFLKQFGKK